MLHAVLSNNLTMCLDGLPAGKLLMSENIVLPDKNIAFLVTILSSGCKSEQLVTCDLSLFGDEHKRVPDRLAATIVNIIVS